ncbi:SDR family oxidoreductase [Chondromyces apiculatus]|uniref:3-oxoacyl-[acyl-carrier protein] reductase n=1 Tax=Chondromyces apiculatus DSM 436 TaxID=1192034 RepID=A0A017TDB1_9BACT|nr:SDR family oxidoreductase [Chondromyces apiculatus]EYF07229.1 3-oxoacyl-[acyl-carrier protein] reductase [Chondromyces apiculatus DSM 436]
MAKRLEGKVAVITGGTSGIGLATAKLFHEEGARVLVTGSNPRTLEAARTELEGIAEVVQSDAGDRAQIEALFDRVQKDLGGLDVLFLNAGILVHGTLATLDEAQFDEAFRVNVKGAWLALKAATPLLRAGGAVVLNSSITNAMGTPGSGAYGASKAALRSLGRTAASELADQGVRVNVISPGPTDTGIIEKSGGAADVIAGTKQRLRERSPQKRLGASEEIARAVLFLASDDASYMTGEEIVVDGGMTRV